MSDVGCNQPRIDDHDARVIRETIDGTYTYSGSVSGVHGLPDSQDDVGGWEDYSVVQRPTGWDSDHDGLPDWWELIKGTNPNSAPGDFSDSNADPDGDGYTDLEDYLNWLAAIHTDCARGSHVDMDLTQFTRGFTNVSPVYSVSNPANGGVTLLAGQPVARFTPTTGLYGLGGFQFKVTDASGFSYTNTVGIHVHAYPQSQLSMAIHDGVPQLQFAGEPGFYFLLQYSDDLVNWTMWTNAIATVSAQGFTPPGFPNSSARFYRAASLQ